MYTYANIHEGQVYLTPIDFDGDEIIDSAALEQIMGNAFVEVTTRRGGYHDTSDIVASEYVRWDNLPQDHQAELIEQEVRQWAKSKGYNVLDINIF